MSAPNNSLQQPRVRRSNAGSPGSFNNGCRLHPIRATVPFQLMRAAPTSPTRAQVSHGGATSGRGSSPPGSPTLSPGSANAKLRLSPENKDSSCPPDSPVSRGIAKYLFFLTVTPTALLFPRPKMPCHSVLLSFNKFAFNVFLNNSWRIVVKVWLAC